MSSPPIALSLRRNPPRPRPCSAASFGMLPVPRLRLCKRGLLASIAAPRILEVNWLALAVRGRRCVAFAPPLLRAGVQLLIVADPRRHKMVRAHRLARSLTRVRSSLGPTVGGDGMEDLSVEDDNSKLSAQQLQNLLRDSALRGKAQQAAQGLAQNSGPG